MKLAPVVELIKGAQPPEGAQKQQIQRQAYRRDHSLSTLLPRVVLHLLNDLPCYRPSYSLWVTGNHVRSQ